MNHILSFARRIGTTLITLAFLGVCVLPLAAYAQDYKPLAPLPEAAPSAGTNLVTYLPGMFRLLIAITAVLAVIMLIIGGFEYVTTDSIYGKSDGQQKIRNAITGLLLAIVSWLILYSINPNLVSFNLQLSYTARPAASGGAGTGGIPSGGGPQLTHQAARARLEGAGFGIHSSGGCSDPLNPNCTSFTNIQQSTVEGVIALKNACGAGCTNLTITGGTEIGHATGGYTHSAGYKIDISTQGINGAALGAYIQNRIGQAPVPDRNYTFTENGYKYIVRFERDHWDTTIIPVTTAP